MVMEPILLLKKYFRERDGNVERCVENSDNLCRASHFRTHTKEKSTKLLSILSCKQFEDIFEKAQRRK